MLFQERLPPLRVISDHEFSPQRQHHRDIIFLRVLNRLHGRFRHRLARLTTHQIGGQHQRRRARDHLFRDALRAQLIHVAWADGKRAFAGIANERKTAANRPVNALKIVQIGTAGGVAEIAVGIAADFNIAAHHAQQDRTVIRQHGIVVHGVPDSATGKLMGDQVFAHQLLVQRLSDIIFYHQRMAGT